MTFDCHVTALSILLNPVLVAPTSLATNNRHHSRDRLRARSNAGPSIIRAAAGPAIPALYDIHHAGHRFWNELSTPVAVHNQRTRVLRSHNTLGVHYIQDADDGTARVVDWAGCPALLYHNPSAYLHDHPHIEAVYVETHDDDTYSASVGGSDNDVGRVVSIRGPPTRGSGSVVGGDSVTTGDGIHSIISATTESTAIPIHAALVYRRSEFSYDLARIFREMQHDAFDRFGRAPPSPRHFPGLLHGR